MGCPDYCPPLVEQLHGPDPTAGSDCAIACARMALMFASCGHVDPSIDKIRAQAGLDRPDPPPDDYSTTMTEYRSAVLAFDDRFRELGYEGVKANATERGSWEDLEAKLKDEDRWVTTFVDYGTLNRLEPAKSGDTGFAGAHAIGVFGYQSKEQTADGSVKFRVFDPLCDGRRPDVPKGPTWWKASTLRDACDDYAGGGEGTATWCVTPRAVFTDPEPEPQPPDPCATSYQADRAAMLEELRQFLGTIEASARDRAKIRDLANWIRRHQGSNREGRSLPVRSGVTPDDS